MGDVFGTILSNKKLFWIILGMDVETSFKKIELFNLKSALG